MRKCKYFTQILFTAEHGLMDACKLRNKPTECQGDKTQCWYPELLHKVDKSRRKNKT